MYGCGILPCSSIVMPRGIFPSDLRKPSVLKVIAASSSLPNFSTESARASTCLAPGLSSIRAFIAAERSLSICFKGATPLGQYCVQWTHLTQSHMPCSSESRSSLLTPWPSLTSPTNLHAFARAAGAMKRSSISRELHSALQQAHITHLWLWSVTSAASAVTGFRAVFSVGIRKGETFSILFQNGVMSTTRSFTGLWFWSGSMVIPPILPCSGRTWRLQASLAKPFTVMAQEPHIADRQGFLNDRVESCSSDIFRSASRTVIPSVTSTVYAW